MPALSGRTVVVTRAPHQSAAFVRLLEAEGARVVRFPVIAIAEPASWAPVDESIAALPGFAWVVFTSANAVDAFLGRTNLAPGVQVAAVGPATAQALAQRGVAVQLMPESHVAEGLAAEFARLDLRDQRVLLPRAAAARDVLPEALRRQGALVTAVDVYRNVLPDSPGEFPAQPDWITFTSASTVKNLLALVPRELWGAAKLASIGPETSAALRKHGLPVTVEAAPSTQEALVRVIALWENSAQ
ncbi:MAG: uroporphyrinogen-III synthase [Bryobacteraceae bacterium]|nr:uroporphyrinogen-III synthase [Bryobacteraceae bacterium]